MRRGRKSGPMPKLQISAQNLAQVAQESQRNGGAGQPCPRIVVRTGTVPCRVGGLCSASLHKRRKKFDEYEPI